MALSGSFRRRYSGNGNASPRPRIIIIIRRGINCQNVIIIDALSKTLARFGRTSWNIDDLVLVSGFSHSISNSYRRIRLEIAFAGIPTLEGIKNRFPSNTFLITCEFLHQTTMLVEKMLYQISLVITSSLFVNPFHVKISLSVKGLEHRNTAYVRLYR